MIRYDDAVRYFSKNKNRPWRDWLNIEKIFPRRGKQGIIGLIKFINYETLFIFKISQAIDYLVKHESVVMEDINKISFCPNFCRSIGTFEIDINPNNDENPFDGESKYIIKKPVLVMEYLKETYKLYNHIFSSKTDEAMLFSIVKSVLLSLEIAQRNCDFTHYDLHSNNVMVKSCNPNSVFLYIIDENIQYCVSSNGYYPIIIDYGFSYSKNAYNKPMWSTLNHTDAGFFCDRFDPIADPKLFLVTTCDEIHNSMGSKKSRKLFNMSINLFSKLRIDWQSGWDEIGVDCVTDKVLGVISKQMEESRLFRHNEYYCLDILQSLIILPLQEQDPTDIKLSFAMFLREFIKIENLLSSEYYCLYILSCIVDAVRDYRSEYLKDHSRTVAVNKFKSCVNRKLDSIANYCVTDHINFEKLLCGLISFGKNMEGILNKEMEKRVSKNYKRYEKLPFQTIPEMYSVIDMNIPDEFIFNTDTEIVVIDNIDKTRKILKISDESCDLVNSTESSLRGEVLYDLYLKL